MEEAKSREKLKHSEFLNLNTPWSYVDKLFLVAAAVVGLDPHWGTAISTSRPAPSFFSSAPSV
jgi:hypothetical protein